MKTAAGVLRAHVESLRTSAPAFEVVLFGVPEAEACFLLLGDEPTFRVSAHWADVLDLIEGYGSVEAALIDGRLKISGDLILATQWVPILFSRGESTAGPASSNRGS